MGFELFGVSEVSKCCIFEAFIGLSIDKELGLKGCRLFLLNNSIELLRNIKDTSNGVTVNFCIKFITNFFKFPIHLLILLT